MLWRCSIVLPSRHTAARRRLSRKGTAREPRKVRQSPRRSRSPFTDARLSLRHTSHTGTVQKIEVTAILFFFVMIPPTPSYFGRYLPATREHF
jgi:hypothetical protein